jgi:hydrogenase maturation protease
VILAFALGNPLRRDDGAGSALARGLEALLPGLEVVEAAELLPEHAEAVSRAQAVLFLDAAASGPPGEVRAGPVAFRAARGALLHALQPDELLGLARALHGRAPPAGLVTIAGADFTFGDGLSPAVEASLPLARERTAELATRLSTAPHPDGA